MTTGMRVCIQYYIAVNCSFVKLLISENTESSPSSVAINRTISTSNLPGVSTETTLKPERNENEKYFVL
jgi:hypothetical protein